MAFLAEKTKTRILKAGKLNNHIFSSGFTLIELIVVMSIISLLVLFAVPEFSHRIIRDDTKITVNQIVYNIENLRQNARIQNKDLYMCFQTATNFIYMGERPPAPDLPDTEASSRFPLPSDVRIDDIEFFIPPAQMNSTPCIRFDKKGYSDWAIIHLSDTDGRNFSLVVEPFLPTQIHKGYVRLDPGR